MLLICLLGAGTVLGTSVGVLGNSVGVYGKRRCSWKLWVFLESDIFLADLGMISSGRYFILLVDLICALFFVSLESRANRLVY